MGRLGGKYRRRRPLLEPEPAILIVTEGEKTEPLYLGELRKRLHLAATRVEISKADGTDPSTIVEYAISARERRRLQAKRGEGVGYEEVWVVFDSEQRIGTEELRTAVDKALRENVFVAMSCPCFEYWFILHFEYTTAYMCTYEETRKKLKSHVPKYDKSNPPVDVLLPRLGDAVKNAIKCRLEQNKHGAPLPRTDVDLLVTRLNCAARYHNRLIVCEKITG